MKKTAKEINLENKRQVKEKKLKRLRKQREKIDDREGD